MAKAPKRKPVVEEPVSDEQRLHDTEERTRLWLDKQVTLLVERIDYLKQEIETHRVMFEEMVKDPVKRPSHYNEGGGPGSYLARQIVHTVIWGIANTGIDRFIENGVEYDEALAALEALTPPDSLDESGEG